jgi:hypothetical protein
MQKWKTIGTSRKVVAPSNIMVKELSLCELHQVLPKRWFLHLNNVITLIPSEQRMFFHHFPFPLPILQILISRATLFLDCSSLTFTIIVFIYTQILESSRIYRKKFCKFLKTYPHIGSTFLLSKTLIRRFQLHWFILLIDLLKGEIQFLS